MVGKKNAAKVVAALVGCLMDWWSSSVATQLKPIDIYTFEVPTTIASKLTPPPISDSSSVVTLDQVKQLWEERESKLFERILTMQHNARLRNPSIMRLSCLIARYQCHRLLGPRIFPMACRWIILRVKYVLWQVLWVLILWLFILHITCTIYVSSSIWTFLTKK
jgi:hypothetical protein